MAEYVRAFRGTPAGSGALFQALSCVGVTLAAAARFAGLLRTLDVLGSAALRWAAVFERLDVERGAVYVLPEALFCGEVRGMVTRGAEYGALRDELRLPPKPPPLRRAASARPLSRARDVRTRVSERFISFYTCRWAEKLPDRQTDSCPRPPGDDRRAATLHSQHAGPRRVL